MPQSNPSHVTLITARPMPPELASPQLAGTVANFVQSAPLAPLEPGVAAVDLHAWLNDRVIQILKARTATRNRVAFELKCEPYFGRSANMWGYSFCFEHRHPFFNFERRFLMLKRSHYSADPPFTRHSVDDLIHELETQVVHIPPESFGTYHHKIEVAGTYCKLECDGPNGRFYYKISESGNMQPFNYEGLLRGAARRAHRAPSASPPKRP